MGLGDFIGSTVSRWTGSGGGGDGTSLEDKGYTPAQIAEINSAHGFERAGLLKKYAPSTAGESIESQIEGLPEYQISDEATQRMKLLQETGQTMVEGAEEVTDIARMRAGMVEAPGTGQGRRDIESASARQVQAIQQIGGAGALGAATQVGLGEEKAYEDLIQSNMQYKDQSESALMAALQTEAGIRTQAAGLEGQALEGMISEKDKLYQSQMNKAQTGLQYDISKLAMEEQRKSAEQNKPKFLGLF